MEHIRRPCCASARGVGLGPDAGHLRHPGHGPPFRRLRQRVPDRHHGDAGGSRGPRPFPAARGWGWPSPRSSIRVATQWSSARPSFRGCGNPPGPGCPLFVQPGARGCCWGSYIPPYPRRLVPAGPAAMLGGFERHERDAFSEIVFFERRPAPFAAPGRARVRRRAMACARECGFETRGGSPGLDVGTRAFGAAISATARHARRMPSRRGLLQGPNCRSPSSSAVYPDISDFFPCGPAGCRRAAAREPVRACGPDAQVDQRPWLDHGLWGGGFSRRCSRAPQPAAHRAPPAPRRLSVRPASKATASTRSPSGRSHARGHRARPTSASRWSGEKVLRLEEHLGYAHKGESSGSIHGSSHRSTPIDFAGRVFRRFDGGVSRGAWCMGARVGARMRDPRAVRPGCGPCSWSGSAWPNPPGRTSGRWATTRHFSFGLAAVLPGLREDLAAPVPTRRFAHRLMMDVHRFPGGVDAGSAPWASATGCGGTATRSSARGRGRLRRIYDEHARPAGIDS